MGNRRVRCVVATGGAAPRRGSHGTADAHRDHRADGGRADAAAAAGDRPTAGAAPRTGPVRAGRTGRRTAGTRGMPVSGVGGVHREPGTVVLRPRAVDRATGATAGGRAGRRGAVVRGRRVRGWQVV